MKFCQEHWNGLRAAIEERGLTHLVARGGKEAVESLAREARGEATKDDFDPLMAAHNMILGQFVEDIGLAAFDGEKCPLCEVEKSRAGLAKNWTDGSADSALEMARELGLAPAQQ